MKILDRIRKVAVIWLSGLKRPVVVVVDGRRQSSNKIQIGCDGCFGFVFIVRFWDMIFILYPFWLYIGIKWNLQHPYELIEFIRENLWLFYCKICSEQIVMNVKRRTFKSFGPLTLNGTIWANLLSFTCRFRFTYNLNQMSSDARGDGALKLSWLCGSHQLCSNNQLWNWYLLVSSITLNLCNLSLEKEKKFDVKLRSGIQFFGY